MTAIGSPLASKEDKPRIVILIGIRTHLDRSIQEGKFSSRAATAFSGFGMRFASVFVWQHVSRLSALLPEVYWMIRRPASSRYGTRVLAGFIRGEDVDRRTTDRGAQLHLQSASLAPGGFMIQKHRGSRTWIRHITAEAGNRICSDVVGKCFCASGLGFAVHACKLELDAPRAGSAQPPLEAHLCLSGANHIRLFPEPIMHIKWRCCLKSSRLTATLSLTKRL